MIKIDKKKIAVAMSGGVDSSVTAHLLLGAGYDVFGITMVAFSLDGVLKGMDVDENSCNALTAVRDAQAVCDQLGIDLHIVNFEKSFEEEIIGYFTEEYEAGRTPNPCIRCNRLIKYGLLLEKALELGADLLATGHYARKWYDASRNRHLLGQAKDKKKDQSYVLYSLNQEQLSKIMFPLADYSKSEIREIAREAQLVLSDKADSQEICFIPNDDYKSFLDYRLGEVREFGNFVDKDGKILGKHQGIRNYTIGQRKGLGLALGYPAYVKAIDAEKRQIIVGYDKEIYSNELIADQVNWVKYSEEELNKLYIKFQQENTDEDNQTEGEFFLPAYVKIRSTAEMLTGNLIINIKDTKKIKILFNNPARAITPGQGVVFYDEEGVVIGGGRILSAGEGV